MNKDGEKPCLMQNLNVHSSRETVVLIGHI